MHIVALSVGYFLVHLSFCNCFREWKSVQIRSHQKLQSPLFLVGHLGSDEFQRPNDENSPEFQQYLQKLLEMQSLRAKGGFASPSSASSDAYMAKLNRIKLEKRARRAAGLSPDDLDTSYKPVDYKNAM